jgi:hypothetical protein
MNAVSEEVKAVIAGVIEESIITRRGLDISIFFNQYIHC